MPNCYWSDLCDCPNMTPAGNACTEHTGFNCSIFQGVVITEARQVNDANTAVLEAAIAAMDDNRARLDAIRAEVATIGQEATQAQTDASAAQDRINSGQADAAERAQIANRLAAITNQINGWGTDLQGFATELETIAGDRDAVIQRILALLNRPYLPTGFCECDEVKKFRLARIDNLITLDLGALARADAAARNHLAWVQREIVVLIALAAIVARIGFAAIIAGGAGTVIIVLLVALALVVVLLTDVTRLIEALGELVDIKRRLLKELLWYYRLDLIPVCSLTLAMRQREREEEVYASAWEKAFIKDIS